MANVMQALRNASGLDYQDPQGMLEGDHEGACIDSCMDVIDCTSKLIAHYHASIGTHEEPGMSGWLWDKCHETIMIYFYG